jgi:hypothetical protein
MNSDAAVPRYGSLDSEDTNTEPTTHEEFDVDNAYYLKQPTLTPAEQWRRLLRMAVPLLVAAFIIGGIAFVLSRDFRNLYPGPGGSNGGGGRASPVAHPTMPVAAPLAPPPPHPLPFKPPAPVVSPVLTAPSPLPPTPIAFAPLPPFTRGKAGSAACLAHQNCWKLNLEGDCCPTPENVTLDCCSL